MSLRYHVFATAFGHAALAWRGEALVGLRLPAEHPSAAEAAMRRRWLDAVPAEPPPVIADTAAAIERYFAGESVDFSNIALDLSGQPDFTTRVYTHIRGLARGETTTYGAVARALGGGPDSARAVGRAMATNPVPLIIPCHRVLGANDALVGFSAPGGIDAKARMLALEGATVVAQQTFTF